MHFFYSVAFLLALLVTLPYWLLKMLTAGKYRAGLAERLGRVPQRILRTPPQGCIWIHAVSVGEVLAIRRLAEELSARHPGRRLLVSTTTATGQQLARETFGEENAFFFPLDLPFCVGSYVRALRPALVVLAETEFWPNFLRIAHGSGAPIAVVNARVSDRSFPRYRALQFVWRRVLRHIEVFLAQSELDAQRLVEIGAPADRVRVSGNLKFEVAAPVAKPVVELLRSSFARSQVSDVLVAGSTVEGEEPLLVEAFRALCRSHPRATLVLAPRHPERFEAVAALLLGSSLSFIRRSRMSGQESCAGAVILLDTLGELAAIYQLASLAFVGGSLVPRGGHNILEPAQHGLAIVVGPHTENFRDIVNIFSRAGALSVVQPDYLAAELLRLLDDPAFRRGLGQHAAEVFRAQSGATARTLEALAPLLPARESRAG